jgi:HK97 family phage major capsid protein
MTAIPTFRDSPPARLDGIEVCRDAALVAELRAAADANPDKSPGTMTGHFSTFNDWYEINSFWEGKFIERIAPGAFKRTINNRSNQSPVRVLLDHGFDPGMGDRPLGLPEMLQEDATGPYAEVPLFEGVPQIIVSGLRAGAYGQSFRFNVMADDWVEDPEADTWEDPGNDKWTDLPQRTIREVRLIEFGPTAFPANPAADAGLRSAGSLRSSTDDFYERLRRRDPVLYDQALARTKEIRTPVSAEPAIPDAAAGATGTIETVTLRTSEPEPATITAPVAVAVSDDPPTPAPSLDSLTEHSEDAPAERHSEAIKRPPARAARVDSSSPRPEGPTPMPDLDPLTSEEREARQSEIRVRLQEIDNEFNGATLPGETQNEWDSLNTEFDSNETAIAADQRRKARLADMASRQAGEQVTPQVPHVIRRPDNIYDLAAIRQQARSIDEVPSLMRDAAMRIVEQTRFPGRGVKHSEAADHIQYLLDFVDDEHGTFARRLIVTGSPTYQRAFGKACLALSTNTLTAEESRALAMGAGASGAFAVPFTLDPTVILTSTGVLNPIRQIARIETITGQQWQGVTSAGIVVSRAAEAAPASDNSPALAQPTLTPTRVQGFVPFSYEVDQDWTGLQSEMFRLLADAKNVEEGTAFINGTGIGVNPNGVVKTLNASQQIGTAGATVLMANVYSLESGLNPRFRPGATFLASKSTYNLIRNLDNTGGSQLWQRVGFGIPPELLGYPALEVSTMVTGPNNVGDRWMIFGDFSQFLIVDRLGMSVELIPQIFNVAAAPGLGMPTGQRGLYAIWRNSSKILADAAFQVLQRTS